MDSFEGGFLIGASDWITVDENLEDYDILDTALCFQLGSDVQLHH